MSVLPLGRSVYLSQPETVEAALALEDARDVPLFLSLHISEEMNEEYCAYARQTCRKLAERGYRMIADVSVKTCAVFQQPDLALLARELGLCPPSGLRPGNGSDLRPGRADSRRRERLHCFPFRRGADRPGGKAGVCQP